MKCDQCARRETIWRLFSCRGKRSHWTRLQGRRARRLPDARACRCAAREPALQRAAQGRRRVDRDAAVSVLTLGPRVRALSQMDAIRAIELPADIDFERVLSRDSPSRGPHARPPRVGPGRPRRENHMDVGRACAAAGAPRSAPPASKSISRAFLELTDYSATQTGCIVSSSENDSFMTRAQCHVGYAIAASVFSRYRATKRGVKITW